MAAYRRVDDCGLTACTPGSSPGPTLGIEYGKAFTFLHEVNSMFLISDTQPFYGQYTGQHVTGYP